RRQRAKIDTLTTAAAAEASRSSSRDSPVPAETSPTLQQDIDMDKLMDNRILDNLRPYAEPSKHTRCCLAHSCQEPVPRRPMKKTFSMPALTARWRTCKKHPIGTHI
ncbi:unnamed protein product, partial [Laminaria digitata]